MSCRSKMQFLLARAAAPVKSTVTTATYPSASDINRKHLPIKQVVPESSRCRTHMASISDYLNIADAVYSRDVATWSTARWKIQKWETAT